MTVIKEDVIGNFRITYEKLPEYKCLLLTFHGTYDAVCSSQVIRDAAALMKELDYSTGMIDFRDASYAMSVADAYSRAEEWDKNDVQRTYRLAFVAGNDDSHANLGFLHKVLANRGWQIRHYTDMQDALSWLGIARQ